MLRRSFDAKSIHLRDSYIAISIYVHPVHIRRPGRQFPRPRHRARQGGPATTCSHAFSTLRNLKSPSQISQDEDIFRGFPELPESGSVLGTIRKNGAVDAPTPPPRSEESLSSDPGPDPPIRKILPKKKERLDHVRNKTSALSQEDLSGTAGGHNKRGDRPHSSQRYGYMGMFLYNTPLCRPGYLMNNRAIHESDSLVGDARGHPRCEHRRH